LWCLVLRVQNLITLCIHQYLIECFLVSNLYRLLIIDVNNVLQSTIVQNIV
jgi:hypothetical protein